MEDGNKHLLSPSQQQLQQQQQQQQQHLLMQQIQRQRDAISRFPSNIDAHLRARPININPQMQNQMQIQQNPNPNPNPNPISSSNNNTPPQQQQHQQQQQQQQQQHYKASLQLAYQDAWRVCHPDFKNPFTSIEDACERLLPYHVVSDYEAEEDDKILDSDSTGQILSRSQQWDHNIAAKVSEFTATFEKQVLAFNIISRKRGLGEFRTEEKLMMEQFLLQEEKRSLLELRAEMESRQKAEANMRMGAEMMMSRAPIRSNARSGSSHEMEGNDDFLVNGWGGNVITAAAKDDNNNNREPLEDFLNDDETDNGDTAMQGEWHGGGEFDLNDR